MVPIIKTRLRTPRRVLIAFGLVWFAALAAQAVELVQSPKMIDPAVPAYPQGALRQEVEGTVLLRVRVLASGDVGEVRVHRSSGSADLDQAAVAAARRSRFEPARNEAGVSVDTWVGIPYKFVLQD